MVIGNCLYACGLSVCLCSKWQESKKYLAWKMGKIESLEWRFEGEAPFFYEFSGIQSAVRSESGTMEGSFSLVGVARPDYYREGKHPIEGTSLVVSVEDSKNEPLEKRTSESHRKHIDLQYVVKGTERLHCWIMSLQRLIANIVRKKMLFTMILIRKKLPLSTLFPVSFSCSSRPTGILQR